MILREENALPFNEMYHSFVDSRTDFLEAFINNIEDPVYRGDVSDKLSASIRSYVRARDNISWREYRENPSLCDDVIFVLLELKDIITQMTQKGEISSDNPVAVTMGWLQQRGRFGGL
jgi:hypothetical protein